MFDGRYILASSDGGRGGCFLRIVMENVFRAEDCDGKQGKSAPRRQDIHVASPLQEYNKNL